MVAKADCTRKIVSVSAKPWQGYTTVAAAFPLSGASVGGPSWSAPGIRATTLSLSKIGTPSGLVILSTPARHVNGGANHRDLALSRMADAAENHRAEVNSDTDAQGHVELALERWAASLYRLQHS